MAVVLPWSVMRLPNSPSRAVPLAYSPTDRRMHRAPRADTALPTARTHTLAQFFPQESELEPESNNRQPSFQDDGGLEAVPQLTLELDLQTEPKPEPTIATSSPRVHRRPVTPPHTETAVFDPQLDFQPHTEAEQARPATQKAEQERIAADQTEQARPATQKAEQERIAAVQTEQARPAAQKAEQERIAADQTEQARPAAQKAEQEHIAADQTEQARPAAEKAEQERVTAEPEPEPEPEPTVALSPAVPECEAAGSATLADSAPQEEPVFKVTEALPTTHHHAAVSVGEIDCEIDLRPLSNQQLVAIVKEFVSSGAQSSLLADLILEQRLATDRAAVS